VFGLAAVYLIGRTIGKLSGSYVSASITKSEDAVKKYLGTCLMCQAGVALGLSFIIEEQFIALGGPAADAGIIILSVVGLSTMVLELIGPLVVKWGLRQAGELGNGETGFVPTEYEEDERSEATQAASTSYCSKEENKATSQTNPPEETKE
jgi:hypothetical protein